jgi:hypothetical protein
MLRSDCLWVIAYRDKKVVSVLSRFFVRRFNGRESGYQHDQGYPSGSTLRAQSIYHKNCVFF